MSSTSQFLYRIDNFKKNAVEKKSVVIAYTVWISLDYTTAPTTMSNDISTNINMPVDISITCFAPKCFLYSSFINQAIVSNCFHDAIVPCTAMTIGQTLNTKLCWSPDSGDGLKGYYQKVATATDPTGCPTNAACSAAQWTYPSSSFGMAVNSKTFNDFSGTVKTSFPISPGLQLLSQVRYNMTNTGELFDGLYPNRVDTTIPNPPFAQCSALPGWPGPANVEFVDFKAFPTFVTRTVAKKSFAAIFGQIGGISSGIATVFGIAVLIYRFCEKRFCGNSSTPAEPISSILGNDGSKDQEMANYNEGKFVTSAEFEQVKRDLASIMIAVKKSPSSSADAVVAASTPSAPQEAGKEGDSNPSHPYSAEGYNQ